MQLMATFRDAASLEPLVLDGRGNPLGMCKPSVVSSSLRLFQNLCCHGPRQSELDSRLESKDTKGGFAKEAAEPTSVTHSD